MMSNVLGTWKDDFTGINERNATKNRAELENWRVDAPTLSL
jgi:hypothetical protein